MMSLYNFRNAPVHFVDMRRAREIVIMFLVSHTFSKNTLFVVLFTFIFMMSAGGVISSEMMMQDGMMQPCPFMGTAAICNMSPIEHLSEWQSMFVTTTQQFGAAALLLLLALALAWHFLQSFLTPPPKQVFVRRHRYKERVFDPLRLLFSRGILNPKLY